MRIFFYIALFFSFFRSSMISLAITKVEHCCIRQMRFRVIISGGHDNTPFKARDARRPALSNPADSTAPFEAGACTCRSRQIRLHRAEATSAATLSAVAPAGCEKVGCEQKNGAHTPLGSALPHSPTRRCFSSLFSLFSSQLQL
jgi:hypothetical protein